MGHGRTDAKDESAVKIAELTALLSAIVLDDKVYEACPYCTGCEADSERCPMARAHKYLFE